jgi:O-antigen/teichoic acid export membrane protein
MSESKKFAFDVSLTFVSSLINMFLGFIITVLLGRYLGAGELGLYGMILTIQAMALVFASIGFPSAILKYVAEYRNDRHKTNMIVSSGIINSIMLGIFFSILLFFSSGIFEDYFNMPGLSSLLKLLSPIFPFALVGAVQLGLLNGLREMKKYATSLIIQSILMMVISVPLIYWGFGAAGAIIGVVLSSIGMNIYLTQVTNAYFNFTFDEYARTTKKMLQFGAKIFAAGSVNIINSRIDLIIIGLYLTSTDIGYYTIAISLSNFFLLIPSSVQKIAFPATSTYWKENNHIALNNMLNKGMKYCTIILVLIGLGLGFFAEYIITIIFQKEDFVSSVLPLQILLIGTVIRGSIATPIGGSLSGIGRPGMDLIPFTIIAIMNITLNIILIPKFGIIGAAIATTISLSAGTFITLYFTTKFISIKIEFYWFLKIIALVLIAVTLFKFGVPFIDQFLLGGAILIGYTILIYHFFITEEDKNLLRSLSNSLIYRR